MQILLSFQCLVDEVRGKDDIVRVVYWLEKYESKLSYS